MISPVIVEVRRGAVTAYCRDRACAPREKYPLHLLYAGMNLRTAETMADRHLKQLRDGAP